MNIDLGRLNQGFLPHFQRFFFVVVFALLVDYLSKGFTHTWIFFF